VTGGWAREKCWRNRLETRHFPAGVTAPGRTGQLGHRGNRFELQFGLEFSFAHRMVSVGP